MLQRSADKASAPRRLPHAARTQGPVQARAPGIVEEAIRKKKAAGNPAAEVCGMTLRRSSEVPSPSVTTAQSEKSYRAEMRTLRASE